MIWEETLTLYDALDLLPSASPQEILEGYRRTKATFNRDSAALYTVFSAEEREAVLRSIEDAYAILSDPQKRRHYDQSYGFLNPPEQQKSANVISIDRVPPMENRQDQDQLLIPPATDFAAEDTTGAGQISEPKPNAQPAQTQLQAQPPASSSKSPHPLLFPMPKSRENQLRMAMLDPELAHAIDTETEWRGTFIRKIRESYRISLEELVGITKVTKTYITAIEEDNYDKLPAPVYIRGFVTQVAKVLKLPHEKVALAYLSRYHRSQKRV